MLANKRDGYIFFIKHLLGKDCFVSTLIANTCPKKAGRHSKSNKHLQKSLEQRLFCLDFIPSIAAPLHKRCFGHTGAEPSPSEDNVGMFQCWCLAPKAALL